MNFVSFGPDAGHVMEALLEHAGISEVAPGIVKVQPEADQALIALLQQIAEGGWVVELLKAGAEPDQGQGELIRVTDFHPAEGELFGALLNADGTETNSIMWASVHNIGKIHIY